MNTKQESNYINVTQSKYKDWKQNSSY